MYNFKCGTKFEQKCKFHFYNESTINKQRNYLSCQIQRTGFYSAGVCRIYSKIGRI